MSNIVQVAMIITPKPKKIEQAIERLASYADWVNANEPGCLRYELFRQMNGDAEVLVIMEVFKNMETREAHKVSPEHVELLKRAAADDILACAPDTKELKNIGGFNRSG